MRYKHLEYTSVAELIQQLQEFVATDKNRANWPVAVDGNTPVFIISEPYYYDGGYYLEDVEHPKGQDSYVHYVRSRTIAKEDKDFNLGWVLHLRSKRAFSDEGDTVDGKTENCPD